MARMVMDELAACLAEAEAGPALWHASVARTIEVVRPAWTGEDVTWDGFLLVQGGIAISLATYILASTRHVAPDRITRADVEEFQGGRGNPSTLRWEAELALLGHHLGDDAGEDVVAARWAVLRRDLSPPESAPDAVWEDSLTLIGPMLTNGLDRALAPSPLLTF